MPNHNSSGFSAYFINVHRDAQLGEHGHWSTFLDNSYSAEGIRFEICSVHYRCFLYGFSFLIDKSSTNDLEKWKYLKGQPSFALCSFVCLRKDKTVASESAADAGLEGRAPGSAGGWLSLTNLLPSPWAALPRGCSNKARRENSSPAQARKMLGCNAEVYTSPLHQASK